MEIIFYCGVGETSWNGKPVTPGNYACISPVYGNKVGKRKENSIKVPKETLIIQDSGAFSDGPEDRLPVEVAAARQITHAYKYKYTNQITHVASYDLLIDERWKNGQRFKERWSEDLAEYAVIETINNAIWLSEHRDIIPNKPGLVLSAQGVTPKQYVSCAEKIIPLLSTNDIFGFGGWCITGKMKIRMMPLLAETMQMVFPKLHNSGIKRVHIWGVMLAEALAQIGYWCSKYNIKLSTDSVGPSTRPAFGSWGYADWRNKDYTQPPTNTRGEHRIQHVAASIQWLNSFDIHKYLNPAYSEYLKDIHI